MATITISVLNHGQFVAENRRPVRQLPDGRHGVMYRGNVYPLRPNRQIDLSDATYRGEACRVLGRIPTSLYLKGQQVSQPYYDESGSNLKDGFSARSYGRSKRPADNGIQYEWYIQLERSYPESFDIDDFFDERIPELQTSVTPRLELEDDEGDEDETSLSASAQQWLEIVIKMSEALRDSENVRGDLSSKIQELEQSLSTSQKSHRQENEKVERTLKDTNERFEQYRKDTEERLTSSGLESDLKLSEMAKRLNETQAESDKHSRMWCEQNDVLKETENTLSEKDEKIVMLKQDKRDLKLRLEDAEELKASIESEERNNSPTQREEDLISLFVGIFCSRISLERDSTRVIARALKMKSQNVLVTLATLHSNEGTLKAEKVECAPAWKELRFKSHEFVGRMYFTVSNPKKVLISTRAKQDGDFEWLKKNQS